MKSLHLIAGKDVLRPQFSALVAKNGYTYATNGSALIKMPNDLVFGTGLIEESETLIFDANLWSVLKFHTAKFISREGLNFTNLTAGTTITAKLESEAGFKVVDYESAIIKPETKPIEISCIGLNPIFLADLAKAYGTKNLAFGLQFYGADRYIEILHNDFPDTYAILCPFLYTDKVKGYKEPYRHIPVVESSESVKPKVVAKRTNRVQTMKSDNVIDAVLDLLKKHTETTKAILDDYALGDEDCRMDLAVADENLRDEIEEMEIEDSYSQLLQKVKDHDDFSSEDLLEMLIKEEGEICLHEALQARNYAIIKIDNINDQSKLLDFVEKEIYPSYSDRCKYSI